MRKKYGIQALAWLILIYSTLPIARPISEFLRKKIPFGLSINLLFIIILGIIYGYLFWRIKMKRPSSYLLLFCIAFIVGVIIGFLKIPEEKIHFLQYGILAFLILRFMLASFSQPISYIFTFVSGSLCGWLDEGIQFLLPGRFYDIRDVLFNVLGVLLGLCVTFIFYRETHKLEFRKAINV